MASFDKNKDTNIDVYLFSLALERESKASLTDQLTEKLRSFVSQSNAGTRFPASRQLAGELGISRTVVLAAYDQLIAEGYLTTRQGSGIFVAADLPHLAPPKRQEAKGPPDHAPPRPFQIFAPDTQNFPAKAWSRAVRSSAFPAKGATHGDVFGHYRLRNAIADHLRHWRGIETTWENVIITSGSGDALRLIAGLLKPGASIVTEDPTFAPFHKIMRSSGHKPLPRPVDNSGLITKDLPKADAAIVTPSRQFPLGMPLSAERRHDILAWADQCNALIIEDDYDSEFRYRGQPLPALAGLETKQRVLYMGSFSKLLLPGLGLGYLVIPPRFASKVNEIIRDERLVAPLLSQPILAELMASGEFARHLRRKRRLYAARQQALLATLSQFEDVLIARPDPGGLSLIAKLGAKLADWTDIAVCDHLDRSGLNCRPLSLYYVAAEPRHGLILGYHAFSENILVTAGQRLGQSLRTLGQQSAAHSGNVPPKT